MDPWRGDSHPQHFCCIYTQVFNDPAAPVIPGGNFSFDLAQTDSSALQFSLNRTNPRWNQTAARQASVD
jgi:hypothetical protein